MKRQFALLCVIAAGCVTSKSTPNETKDTATNSQATDSISSDSSEPADSGSALESDACRSGVNPSPLGVKNCVRQAACQWDGLDSDDKFGHAIDIGGDIDGDGLVDWVVGAPYEDRLNDDGSVMIDAGRVHIFRGAERLASEPNMVHLVGSSGSTVLGYATEIVSDLNGDGLDDVVVGGRGTHTDAHTSAGEVQILFGKSDGWDEPEQTPDLVWFGEQQVAKAGSTVHGMGDMNGDGLGELAIATNQRRLSSSGYEQPGSGTVTLFFGQADFSSYAGFSDASAHISGVGVSDAAGHALGSGDMNGDGYRDLIVGAPYGSANQGRVVVFAGGTAPVSGEVTLDEAPVSFTGTSYSDAFGWAVAAGDINGTEYDELIIGAPKADDATPDSGTVHILLGSSDFFDAPTDVAHRITGEWDDHQLGSSILAAKDIDGDGTGDLLLGAIGAWHGLITKGGRVYSMYGPSDSWPSSFSAKTSTRQFLGASTKDYLGSTLAAGDINGDGKTEVMLASGYTQANGHIDVGSVYLFWGE